MTTQFQYLQGYSGFQPAFISSLGEEGAGENLEGTIIGWEKNDLGEKKHA